MEKKISPKELFQIASKSYQEMVDFEKKIIALYKDEDKEYKRSDKYILGQFDCYFQATLLMIAIVDNKLTQNEVEFIKSITKFADVFNDRDLADFINCDKIGIEKITRAAKKVLKQIPDLVMMAVTLDKENDELPNYISTLFNFIVDVFVSLMKMDDDISDDEYGKYVDILETLSKYCEENKVRLISIKQAEKEKEASLDARCIEKKFLNELKECEQTTDFAKLKQEVEKALVYIEVYAKDGQGSGSGFIISPNGYAITCAHVVNGAESIYVRVRPTGEKGLSFYCPATVCQVLKNEDMAVIKLDARNLPYVKLLPEDLSAEAGEEIALFGYPLGESIADNRYLLNPTITRGTVASVQVKEELEQTIIDILAVQGNSGGPIVSVKTGQVVGILLGAYVRGTSPLVYMRPIKYVWQRFTK